MKCPKCGRLIVLESNIPIYKDGRAIGLRKFVECINGHRSEVKIRKRKEANNARNKNGN